MKFVLATLYICLTSNSVCEQKQIKVDPKACSVGQYMAQVPVNGEWDNARVGIKC